MNPDDGVGRACSLSIIATLLERARSWLLNPIWSNPKERKIGKGRQNGETGSPSKSNSELKFTQAVKKKRPEGYVQ